MAILNIALLQIAPAGSTEKNLEKGINYCRRAKDMGADIALFPEMFSSGYDIFGKTAKELNDNAVPANGRFVNAFGRLAKELDMAIAVTFLEKHKGAPRNSVSLFDRAGKRLFTYAKVHTCDFDAEKNLTAGSRFLVKPLDTAAGTVLTGAMICFDREFPESARILMLKGAELILVPNACPMEINRLSQLRGRAFENMTAIATCNYPASVPDCNGNSTVFDGVAYLPNETDPRDTCILQADESEGIFMARLDLDTLREYRNEEVHGNAFRRPRLYGELIKREVKPPFIRKERRY